MSVSIMLPAKEDHPDCHIMETVARRINRAIIRMSQVINTDEGKQSTTALGTENWSLAIAV